MSADDSNARITARYLAFWLSLARALPSPERDQVCHVLGEHSPTVRRWNRWSMLSALVFVGGAIVLTLGVVGLVCGDDRVWSVAGALGGSVALSGAGAVMWRLNHQAIDVVVGLCLAVLPPSEGAAPSPRSQQQ